MLITNNPKHLHSCREMEGKKITSISSCHALATLLVLLILALDSNTCSAARSSPHAMSSMEFIRTSCSRTDYPSLCLESLSAYANNIHTNPTQLADAALSVSLSNIRDTSTTISKLSKRPGMSSREAEAMSDCMENLGDSIEELRSSMQAMGQLKGKDARLHMSDIQTWVSAALTDENTCMEGFKSKSTKGDAQVAVRSRIVKVAHLTSNALALVNGLAGTLSSSP